VTVNTFDISTWSISQDEINKALANSSIVLADEVIEQGYQDLYSMTSNCVPKKGVKCLYLYLYLLQNYKQNSLSLISEDVMMRVLTNIEQISKSCCNV
jgi:hypothetical protein